ncbi:MAG: Chromosome partition protein smc [Parcubacteria group bacterium Gr01-1014_46]|nr:MAG: Chromosome partition protein smc [Parcubacteria group bacterium Gr01-1014_46]
MYLKSIELSGFKSFAKKSELSFNSKVSAIVGPNGSGKSNVAEAFRFVLGEQSIKSLRGKKGEDLIFNGAGDLPRANRASVKVVFDNTSKFLPVDFETVTIERVVHRDGVNEYLINGSQVRLRDVVELLSSAHIGSSGHHIISQGEADRILNSSPKERKNMIEDALGLKMYQYKKTESEKKLEKTRENIGQVESLRREILPHIKFLKKQVEKVERAIQMKDELQREALEYCKREDDYIKKTEERLAKEKEPLSRKEKELDHELKTAKSVLERAKDKDGLSDRLIQLENDLHKTRDEKDELFKNFGRLDGEINSLVKMVRKQEEVARSIEHKTVTLVSVEELSVKIEERVKKARGSLDVNTLASTLDEVFTMLVDFIDHNKDKVEMSLIADVQRDIDNLQVSKKELEEKLEKINKEEKELTLEYNKLKTEIEREKDSNRDAEKAVFRIMAESGEVRSSLHDITLQEENLKLVKDDFKRELTELGVLLGVHLLQFNNFVIENTDEDRHTQEERRKRIEKIKIRLEDSGGVAGTEILKEYTDATERDSFLEKELLDLQNSATSLGTLITDLDQRLSSEFKTGVEKINTQFKEYFSMMFGGGEAKLEVTLPVKKKKKDTDLLSEDEIVEEAESESLETSDEGIEIEVNLPKKKVKGLMMLSGGERALTSIALLFAISQVNPPPFIILDETDAALDEANSKKYADMVENLSNRSQLIVITHNRETMSRAGILYGVTMGAGGGSKLLSVAFEEALAVAK